MKEYLPIIKARSGLFRGIEESELEKLFGCLEARKQTYRKEEYIFKRGRTDKSAGACAVWKCAYCAGGCLGRAKCS